jgi:hypothetical protein
MLRSQSVLKRLLRLCTLKVGPGEYSLKYPMVVENGDFLKQGTTVLTWRSAHRRCELAYVSLG